MASKFQMSITIFGWCGMLLGLASWKTKIIILYDDDVSWERGLRHKNFGRTIEKLVVQPYKLFVQPYKLM
jgi:hypothetical protein